MARKMSSYQSPRYLISTIILICGTLFDKSSSSTEPHTVSFNDGFRILYGKPNVVPYGPSNNSVQISMDQQTSSGFRSKPMYVHGYVEASIKLPENYTAGVVVAMYTCNNEKYPYVRDEIDFEFLGHVDGQPWVVQTNFYGNGSTSRGREERYKMWFDPSEDFHRYGILWTDQRITYYVDNVPIRHVERVEAMGGDFPSKEMVLYGTIWNGSDWATGGGRYKLDLVDYGPYVANFSDFILTGCEFRSAHCNDYGLKKFKKMTYEDRRHMQIFRRKFMTYSYCYDRVRYEVPLPECVLDYEEMRNLQKL